MFVHYEIYRIVAIPVGYGVLTWGLAREDGLYESEEEAEEMIKNVLIKRDSECGYVILKVYRK